MMTIAPRLRCLLAGLLLISAVSLATRALGTLLPVGVAHADDSGGSESSGSDSGGSESGGTDSGGSDDPSGGVGGTAGGASSNAPARAAQDAQTRDQSLASSLKGKIAGVREVQVLAKRAVPGEVINIRLGRQGAGYVYKVRIMRRDGDLFDVMVDATTRDLLGVRRR